MALGGIRFQAQHGLQEKDGGSGGPGLRAATDRIFGWAAVIAVILLEAAEQFRQAIIAETLAGRKNLADNGVGFLAVTGILEPGRQNGVVVRPNATIVVAHGVKAGLFGADGTDTPATAHIFGQHAAHHRFYFIFVHNAAPQAVAGIGTYRGYLPLVLIESLGEKLFFGHPELFVKKLFKPGGFPPQLFGPLVFTLAFYHAGQS